MPELLRERPLPIQAVAAAIVPVIFGAVTGWMLGLSEAVYVILSLLGIGGGYFAGMEHESGRTGAVRGLFGGSLFGASILLVHEATGAEPQAHLPHPEIVLVAITTAFGVGLGALGGRRRQQLEEAGETDRPYLDVHRLGMPELVSGLGAVALVTSLWLPWFATSCDSTSPASPAGCNVNSIFDAKNGVDRSIGQFDAVEAFATLPLLLVILAGVTGLIAWMMARRQSEWRPGEPVMIAGIYALVLVLCNGIILGRPGERTVDVSLQYGYYVAIAGALAIGVAGLLRQRRGSQERTSPPGMP
jgi:hypothetical protein